NSPQGQYDVFASAGSLVSANYDFQFVKGILTIGKAMITVRPVNKTKTYGQANPVLTYVLEGFLNGDNATTAGVTGEPVLTTNAITSSGAGIYEITSSIGTLSSTNYDFGLAKGVLIIDKAPLIVKAADQSRIYGASDPSFTYTLNGFVNGDDASSVSGLAALSTTATLNSGAGTYPIQIASGSLTASNYSFTLQEGTLTIGKAKLLVKAANQSRVYGAANPAFSATYNGLVNGDQIGTINLNGTISFSTLANSSSSVGDYDITVASSSLSSPNYDFDFGTGKLTITKASLSVRAENKTKIYGQVNPALTYTINGYLNNDGAGVVNGLPVLSTLASTGSGVGDYEIGINTGTLDAVNYTFAVVPGKLTIGKATLSVKATDKSRIYGAANPDLTYTLNGFVNGDNASVVSGLAELTTIATAGSSVGNYPIRVALGSLSASNYDFSLQEGTLSIGKAKLTVKAVNQTRAYGAANPEFTATYNGLVNGDQIGTIQLNGTISFSTLANNTSAVGDYEITVASSTLSSTNYDFELGKGILSITKAQLNVRAENKKRIYGQANPALTYTIDGYLNNDGLNV
ncbi:MAG: MBG domain-containing protein, partial [Chitinophagaceae bacterium]